MIEDELLIQIYIFLNYDSKKF